MNQITDIKPLDAALVERKAQALPRYTSYPTANHFTPAVGAHDYRRWLGELADDVSLSLYLHIPYCQNLCWYCACSTKATERYAPVERYLGSLEIEMATVAAQLPQRHSVRHIHWGGGSPDILTPADIHHLGATLHRRFRIDADAEFGVEVDPRLMTPDKANALADVGVNRISIGVQDFDPLVQAAIGRVQDFEVTKAAVDMFRDRGIGSVNLDLVYGLPHQTSRTLSQTLDRVAALAPDRIAVFGYAHLPQRVANQKLIDESALPGAIDRFAMARQIAGILERTGYVALGIDHFALPGDRLAISTLNRNFQGYTVDAAHALVGLGASAISKLPQGYVQNAVPVRDYEARIGEGGLATARGWTLTDDDRARAFAIERLMCDFELSLSEVSWRFGEAGRIVRDTAAQIVCDDEDGLVERTADRLRLTVKGRPFVRNVCARFDAYLDPGTGARHSLSV